MKKLYDKRIAFVISSQHFITSGGIGQFSKSFINMSENMNWKVDIIMDKCPKNSTLLSYVKNKGITIFYQEKNQIKESKHNSTFIFADSMNIEQMLNFRNSMMDSFNHHIYDLVIVNTIDAILPIYFLDIHSYIPVVLYTHSENLIFTNTYNRVFKKSCSDFMRFIMNLPGIVIGTQSELNVNYIKNTNPDLVVEALPMQIPERGLLENSSQEKEGVLFIGRFEPRKNPTVFADIVKKTQLKAKILTNKNGKRKFIEYFKKIGYDNFEIKTDIIGQEKVKFIKSAKVAFHPSKLESYGFCAFESIHSCQTFCLEDFEWHMNFEGMVEVCGKDEIVSRLINAHQSDYDEKEILKKMKKYDKYIEDKWIYFLKSHEFVENNSNSKIVQNILEKEPSPISINMLLKEKMKRKEIGIDDVETIYKKRTLFNIFYTDEVTYIDIKTKNPTAKFEVSESFKKDSDSNDILNYF